ncbi:hypothetical protein OSH04_07845 [Alcaligenes sp. A-TC2]|uniref:hypothetical protein n=1 Tax=Alcaligenes TaxID=507 RepID=UPI0015F25F7E|nr:MULTISPECIES: hypothetical protein [Alcaligenes]MCX5471621.1 hypothetical protein [Alcaligenes nematophilus]
MIVRCRLMRDGSQFIGLADVDYSAGCRDSYVQGETVEPHSLGACLRRASRIRRLGRL